MNNKNKRFIKTKKLLNKFSLKAKGFLAKKLIDFRNYSKDEYKYIKSNKRLMRANKLLGNPFFIFFICILLTFTLFHIINYAFVSLPKLLQVLQGNEADFSFKTAFDYSMVASMPTFFLIAALIILILNIRFIYLLRVSFKNLNVGQKGTSRWTTHDEIKEQYIEIEETGGKGSIVGSGGIPVARIYNKLYIDTSPVNNLIIGITRSGKGEMLVFPMIDIYSRATKPASLVLTDPKLELYASSKQTLIDRGYEVHLINLVEPLKSSGYNPLELIINAYQKNEYTTAEMLCNTFVTSIFKSNSDDDTSQFFSNSGMSLTSALILAQIEDKGEVGKLHEVNMSNIVSLFTELATTKIDETTTALDKYFLDRPDGNRAKLKFAGVNMGSEKTKGNVYSHVLSKLTIFTYSEIAKMTSNNDINLHSIGFSDKPQAVFIGIPDYDTSNHYLASVFLAQLQFVLSKSASLSTSGKCDREVVFILDEFGNLPAISDFANTITVCLGRNIKYNLVIQAYSQIEKLYGKSSETIIGNCGNQFYIQTNDKSTSEHFSALVGSETITNVSRSGEKLKLNKNITESFDERPLLNPAELRRLNVGEIVVCRVMTRKSLKGEDTTPYPIFNTGISKFKFRYEYLLDYFPSKSYTELNLPKKPELLRAQINSINQIKDLTQKDKIIAILLENKVLDTDKIEDIDIEYLTELLEIAENNRIITLKDKNTILFYMSNKMN